VGIKEKRMQRLFAEDGKAVYVPMDHGIEGMQKGLEDLVKLTGELIQDGIDGTLMNFGMIKQTNCLFEDAKNPPARVLGADYFQTWTIPGKSEEISGCCILGTAEQAAKYSCDCVKVMLPFGLSAELELEQIKIISALVGECDQCDMPIMMEPLAMSSSVSAEQERDPETIANACRMAVELGADIIKAPYTGDKDSFALMMKRLRVPFIILGGPKTSGIKGVLQIVKDSVDAGARGPCMGRNVWGRPEVHDIVHALIDIVHKGATVEEVSSKYSLK